MRSQGSWKNSSALFSLHVVITHQQVSRRQWHGFSQHNAERNAAYFSATFQAPSTGSRPNSYLKKYIEQALVPACFGSSVHFSDHGVRASSYKGHVQRNSRSATKYSKELCSAPRVGMCFSQTSANQCNKQDAMRICLRRMISRAKGNSTYTLAMVMCHNACVNVNN